MTARWRASSSRSSRPRSSRAASGWAFPAQSVQGPPASAAERRRHAGHERAGSGPNAPAKARGAACSMPPSHAPRRARAWTNLGAEPPEPRDGSRQPRAHAAQLDRTRERNDGNGPCSPRCHCETAAGAMSPAAQKDSSRGERRCADARRARAGLHQIAALQLNACGHFQRSNSSTASGGARTRERAHFWWYRFQIGLPHPAVTLCKVVCSRLEV
jgi:hypothetical protein